MNQPQILTPTHAVRTYCEGVHEFKIATADYFSNEFLQNCKLIHRSHSNQHPLFFSCTQQKIGPIDQISGGN